MEKMTKREFLTAIVELGTEGTISSELGDFAEEEIAKLDAALAKRKEKVSAKAAENAPLMDKIYEDILKEDEVVTATIVGELMEISTQKASALLRKLVDEKRATAEDVKIPKKGTQKGYKTVVQYIIKEERTAKAALFYF